MPISCRQCLHHTRTPGTCGRGLAIRPDVPLTFEALLTGCEEMEVASGGGGIVTSPG